MKKAILLITIVLMVFICYGQDVEYRNLRVYKNLRVDSMMSVHGDTLRYTTQVNRQDDTIVTKAFLDQNISGAISNEEFSNTWENVTNKTASKDALYKIITELQQLANTDTTGILNILDSLGYVTFGDTVLYLATKDDIKNFINQPTAQYNILPVTQTHNSIVYDRPMSTPNYWYHIEAWYINESGIRITNGFRTLSLTQNGFSCDLAVPDGFIKFQVADSIGIAPIQTGYNFSDTIEAHVFQRVKLDTAYVKTGTENPGEIFWDDQNQNFAFKLPSGSVNYATTTQNSAKQDTTNAVIRTNAFTTDTSIVVVDGTGRKIKQSLSSVNRFGDINIPTGRTYKINNLSILNSNLVSGSAGTLGYIFTGNGTTTAPSWSTVYNAIATTPTQGKLVKFGATKLENSIISENGTVVTVGGTLVANSATTNSEVINLGQLKDKVKSGSISMVTGTWPIYFEKSFPTAGYVTSVWGIDSLGNEIGINVNTQYDYGFEIDVPEDCIVKYDCTYPETITTPENNQWYGIEYDVTNPSPTLTRIGNLSLHAKLPVQNKMKACLLSDTITVNYYLSPTDWTKQVDGVTASVLDGTDGQVMIEKPVIYWKFETEGNINRVKISEYPLAGFSQKPKCYIGAYEAALQRSNSKLASVVNTTTDFRGGNNTSAWDAASNSLLGKPATNYNIVNARTYARNRGTGWNQLIYDNYMELFWLFAIEYATFNSQLAVNNTLTSQGYKQGGLGNGVTTANITEWNAFNSRNPFINCGASNSLASGSGEVSVNVTDFGGTGVTRTFTVNRYRGVENPFGHIWKFVDGLNVYNSSGTTTMYVIDNPSNLASNTSTNSRTAGVIAQVEGYGKTMLFGSSGDIVPNVITGEITPTTYMCDYFYPNPTANSWRIPLFGGNASDGSFAGFLYSFFNLSSSSAYSSFGSRLSAR